MEITPPQAHMHLLVLFKAGALARWAPGAPGVQGPGVAGTQGAGVSTPMAADVAAITAGLEGEEHMPKGKMFTMGWWSRMVAAGMYSTITCLPGNTISVDGTAPKEHCRVAPITTCCAIVRGSLRK
jgi:hypothetical protein